MNHNRKGYTEISKLKGRCSSGKIRYRDKLEAVAALHRIETNRKFDLEDGLATKRTEKRTYKCPECSGIHLTSRTKWYPAKEAA
jgi:hypothetical protein